MKILKQTDLYEILPFKRGKIQELIRAGKLPMVKVGRDYITTDEKLKEWVEENLGKEILF